MPDNRSDQRAPRRGLTIAALQHRIRLEFSGPGADAAATEFSILWEHLLDDGTGGAERDLSIAVPSDERETLDAVQAQATAHITLALIELNLGRGLLFHAAAAVDARGRAFLLVGPSGAGKTTAIGHLGRSSPYLTDETAFVDDLAQVHPYPKPLSIVREGGGKTQTRPADHGLEVPTRDRFPLGRVLIVDRHDGSAPSSTRLSTADGILAVVPELSGLSSHPAPLVALARISRLVGGFERLSYTNAVDIDPCAGPPTSTPLGADELAFVLPARRRPDSAGAGLVQAPTDDAIEVSGMVLVAQRGRVTALSGIARTLWLETARPLPEDVLLGLLRKIHGRVPDDERQFRRVVEGLLDGGILEWQN
jgi:hypothetical protein